MTGADRDRTTVRRALRAGLVVGAVVAAVTALYGAPGAAVFAGGLAVAAFTAAIWLGLAAVLDVLAGDPPGLRRTLWTIAATLVAMLGPFLLVGAFAQAGSS